MSPEPLPLLIVGAGRAVERLYAPAVRGSTSLKTVAIVDVRPERRLWAESTFKVRSYETLAEALSSTLAQASLVAVPTEAQLETVADLLTAGLAVLAEKPLVQTVDQARELLARVETPPLRLALSRRYWDRYQRLSARLNRPVERWAVDIMTNPRDWSPIDGPATGNEALIDDLLPHAFDIATSVLKIRLDGPTQVRSRGSSVDIDFEGEMPGRVSLEYGSAWSERVTVYFRDAKPLRIGNSAGFRGSIAGLATALPQRLMRLAGGSKTDEPVLAVRRLLEDFAQDVWEGRQNPDLLAWATVREEVGRQLSLSRP